MAKLSKKSKKYSILGMILWVKAQRKNAKLFMRPHVPPNMSKNGLASLLEILNVKNYQLSSAVLGARLKKVSNG